MLHISKHYRVYFIILMLTMLTLTVFGQIVRHEFVAYDDNVYIYENTRVQEGLSLEGIFWAFNIGTADNWHPLTWISHMLDCQLFGLDPWGHHLHSLLLHLFSTLLLFALLTRTTKSLWKSGFVAALFAIHPLHVQSVAWAAERKDVLSTFFWIITMLAYVSYTEGPTRKKYLFTAGAFALGLMAKPMLVTLPLVLLLMDYWPLHRLKGLRDAGRMAVEKIPLFMLAIASSALTLMAQKGAISSTQLFPLGDRLQNSLIAYVGYIWKTLIPLRLACFYPLPTEPFPWWQVVGAALFMSAVTLLVILRARTHPYLAFGWFWYVLTLVPVIGIVQVGAQLMADRYTYIPLTGIFVMLAWGIPNLCRKPKLLTPVVLLVLLTSSFLAWQNAGYWKDSKTLLHHALRVTDANYPAHTNLAAVYAMEEDYVTAVDHYVEALNIRADIPSTHLSFGNVLYALGRLDEAILQYKAALLLDPNYSEARKNYEIAVSQKAFENETPAHKEARRHYNRAVEFGEKELLHDALREYREAIRLHPDFAEAYSNLGLTLQDLDRPDEAIEAFKEAIRAKPDFVEAYNNLAIAYYFKGDYAKAWEAVHACRKMGLRPHPQFIQALTEKMPDPGP